ncbi:hypothetical protein [Leptolyngbya sp. BC1307]|uniref:hypothetical protein n=1 Tax=Leptolyngbya sp. BC1307 TaxID=2029589 RepID=UPI0011410915|nr:hypothetical protein [Leptolyngbya sp. BC1307]
MNTRITKTSSKTKRWTAVMIGAGTLVPLLGIGAATASIMPNDIGSTWQQWVLDKYSNPLDYLLGQLEKVDPIFETIMDVALGDDGLNDLKDENGELPEPYELRTTKPSNGPGILNHSPVVRQRDLANLYDQESARAIAAPVLGEQGKTWLTEEAERTAGLIESTQAGAIQVQQMAAEAQGLGVTQDVMKQSAEIDAAIASLLTNQTQLTADNHAALLQLQRLQGIQAQLAANTSEGIDEANRRDRLERQVSIAGASRAPVYIPGLFGTNQTSQE